jgi:hypothetical protein
MYMYGPVTHDAMLKRAGGLGELTTLTHVPEVVL